MNNKWDKLRQSYVFLLFCILSIFLGLFLSKNYVDFNNSTVVLVHKELPKITTNFSYKKFNYNGLVSVVEHDPSIVIDLRYATNNNFTKNIVYSKNICLLQEKTLEKLSKANDDLKSLGKKIKIWDAYRPKQIQNKFWSLVKDRRFIASPNINWSRHNRGAAVDITMVDFNGNEVIMPTDFDNFTTNAYPTNPNLSPEIKTNLELLRNTMIKNGFCPIETEWWHFDDEDADKYPLLDLDFDNIN